MGKHYFHGTTLEHSLRIIEEQELKGNFYYLDQQHAYLTLVDNMVYARQYGEIIFVLKNIEDKLIRVRHRNKRWMKENLEIMQHVYRTKFEKKNIPYEQLRESDEEVYCIKDTLILTDDKIEEILVFDNNYERMEETRGIFKKVTKNKITTIKEPTCLPIEYWIGLKEDFAKGKNQLYKN